MTRHSLRARLAAAAALAIALALVVAGVGLVALFERHVERRMGSELVAQLDQLAAGLDLGADGVPEVAPPPADPRFHKPLGGLYWQVDALDGAAASGVGLLRSRSLWDTALALPPDSLDPGVVHAHRLPGPGGQTLMVRERRLRLQTPAGERTLRIAVGLDRAELGHSRAAFARDMLPYLALIAGALGLATWAQIRAGLRPLERLRREVMQVRSGRARRLPDAFPDEVMPLVAEVNALLGAREEALERARAWTADLAHGLKTPLAALAGDAEALRAAGHAELARRLEDLAQLMRRRVDRELIRGRVRARMRRDAAGSGPASDLRAALSGLVATLERTGAGERLEWRVDTPQTSPLVVALMQDDLLELLGNLLENAAKWARARVEIAAAPEASGGIRVRIGDDGPGVPDAQRTRLGERGLRLDQRTEGSGLGLAIVRDLLEAYGGDIAFQTAPTGGLEVHLWLPSPHDPESPGAGDADPGAPRPRSAPGT
jgi:signal transduction histidine kinase